MRAKKYRKALMPLFLLVLLAGVGSVSSYAQKEPDLARIFAGAAKKKGKRPVIIIPGVLGSELINKKTGEKVWFKLGRSDDDDLRLPVALDLRLSRDNLVPGDIVRKLDIPVLRDKDIYQDLINALERFAGYKQAKWDDPPEVLEDTYFLFPYDWRRDNVETAQILVAKIEALKRRTGRDGLRFDVLAHSMGGLVARYAAMYGGSDLGGAGQPVPDWSGAAHFKRIFFFGTPNLGSAEALQTLLEGFKSVSNVNLPFVRDLTPVELITMPSILQLMPHSGALSFFGEDLKPIEIDIYDLDVWQRYGWSVFGEKDILKSFSEAEVGRMEEYLEIALERARRFHIALDAAGESDGKVAFYVIGSDCIDTLNGFVIYKDPKKDRWITLGKPRSFRNSHGKKISARALRHLLLVPGDGRVARRSLLAKPFREVDGKRGRAHHGIPFSGTFFVCEQHDQLTGNRFIQDNFLTALVNDIDK